MSSPKISVVIPSYNKVRFIGKTLSSIFAQKYPNLELIIQDGGSTDGTLGIIKKYAGKFPGVIKWESNKDSGQLDAINKGLKKATGEILAYINADDVYLRGAFNLLVSSFINNPDRLWFVGRGIVVDEKGDENRSLFYKYLAKPYKNFLLILNSRTLLLCVNYIMQPSVFLTKKAMHKFGLFAGTRMFVMEYEKWLGLSRYEMPVVINADISAFRMATGSITTTKSRELLGEDFDLVRRFTSNPLILGIHFLNNLGRLIIFHLT